MGIVFIISLMLGAVVLLSAASKMKEVSRKSGKTSLLEETPTQLPITKVAVSVVIMMMGAMLLLLSRITGNFRSSVIAKDSLSSAAVSQTNVKDDLWHAPDESTMPAGEEGELVRYGKELIAHTSRYLGPKGSVSAISNGMNCNNCHLDAGTRAWGNNYAAVFSTYPKYRERSGSTETIYKRVNDCFERSLNGQPLDSNSKEM